MIDKIIDSLQREQPPVTKEEFRAWQNDKVTQCMFQSLFADVLTIQSEQPPSAMDAAALHAHRVFSAQVFAEDLMNWEPSNLVSDDEKADQEGGEE